MEFPNRVIGRSIQAVTGIAMIGLSPFVHSHAEDRAEEERIQNAQALDQANDFVANSETIRGEILTVADDLEQAVGDDYTSRFGAACAALIMSPEEPASLDQLEAEVSCGMSDSQIDLAFEYSTKEFEVIADLRDFAEDTPLSRLNQHVSSASQLQNDVQENSSWDEATDRAATIDVSVDSASGKIEVESTENSYGLIDAATPSIVIFGGAFNLGIGSSRLRKIFRDRRNIKRQNELDELAAV